MTDALAPSLPGPDSLRGCNAPRPGALFAALVLAPGVALACGGLAALAVALFSLVRAGAF